MVSYHKCILASQKTERQLNKPPHVRICSNYSTNFPVLPWCSCFFIWTISFDYCLEFIRSIIFYNLSLVFIHFKTNALPVFLISVIFNLEFLPVSMILSFTILVLYIFYMTYKFLYQFWIFEIKHNFTK